MASERAPLMPKPSGFESLTLHEGKEVTMSRAASTTVESAAPRGRQHDSARRSESGTYLGVWSNWQDGGL